MADDAKRWPEGIPEPDLWIIDGTIGGKNALKVGLAPHIVETDANGRKFLRFGRKTGTTRDP